MVITMCVLFVFGNLPKSINDLNSVCTQLGYKGTFFEYFVFFCDTVLMLYHCSDLFVYFTFNIKFRKSLLSLFKHEELKEKRKSKENVLF